MSSIDCQVVSAAFDPDVARLDIRLTDGAEFAVTNPAHAAALKEKLRPHGRINGDQRAWLERYRVTADVADRQRFRARLGALRAELAAKGARQ